MSDGDLRLYAEQEPTIVLSHADIRRLAISNTDVLCAVENVLAEWAGYRAIQHAKVALPTGEGRVVHAMPAVLNALGVSSIKWARINRMGFGSSAIQDTILLTSTLSGSLVAVMDGHWITGARTAAMTVAAARLLATRSPSRIGFIGAGHQAMHHLEALCDHYPSINQVVAATRTTDGARALIARASERGLETLSTRIAREACEGADIVVSSVPAAGCGSPYLDPNWIAPTAFASLIDLGRPWLPFPAGWGELYTDDVEQTKSLIRLGSIQHGGPYESDLRQLSLEGPRSSNGRRRAMIFAGLGIGDAALAVLVDDRARRAGLGWRGVLGPAGAV